MYTKQVIFIVSLSILVAMSNTAWACHESDTGLRGHNPEWRFAGISVVTEAAFALTSTTTGCDHYTYFIQQSYHQIVENAARGEGAYLEAFAHFRGCPAESLDSFKGFLVRLRIWMKFQERLSSMSYNKQNILIEKMPSF